VQNNPTMLYVVAAVIKDGVGRILLQKRPEGREMAGLWEFPGGKIDSGETPESALVRELAEELGVKVDIQDLTPTCFASANIGKRNLLLLLYNCDRWLGEPMSLEQQEIGWFTIPEMYSLEMPPADLPLLPLLQKLDL
jgi:8-oxo-dGTP diphosphatase